MTKICSHCNHDISIDTTACVQYCPICGAKIFFICNVVLQTAVDDNKEDNQITEKVDH